MRKYEDLTISELEEKLKKARNLLENVPHYLSQQQRIDVGFIEAAIKHKLEGK